MHIPSSEIKTLEERQIIDAYVEYVNTTGKNRLKVEQCPIDQKLARDLGQGRSIPDAILKDSSGVCKWLEVTLISRNQSMRQEIGEQRKNVKSASSAIKVVNLAGATSSTIIEISNIINKKSRKNYSDFAIKSKINIMGDLIIGLVVPDPFHDANELDTLCDNFDEHVLFSLGCGESLFDEIWLYTYVMTEEGWKPKFLCLANEQTMNNLRVRQSVKAELLA